MQSPCLHLYKTSFTAPHRLGFNSSSPIENLSLPSKKFVLKCESKPRSPREGAEVRGKKENVWSIDNDKAKSVSETGKEKKKQRRRKGRAVVRAQRTRGGEVIVSGAMLMEVETVLQTQEPVIRPSWNTFASSLSGRWKGVGAVFSPITAEMEPIDIGRRDEHLYDCYTLSEIRVVPSSSVEQTSHIQRKTNWVTLNPYGEAVQNIKASDRSRKKQKDGDTSLSSNKLGNDDIRNTLPDFESFDLEKSDLMEEDEMAHESGFVFFEDGSYSRGPVDIPVGEANDSNYYLTPTFKFEQCLVKGCHKRLRIVHTIEFNDGGSDIQIMRVAVYEEQWVSPANIHIESDLEMEVKPFSQRKRTQPRELTGSWKVFEVSATPVFGAEESSTPYVYLCTETLKKRSLPETPVYFREEEMVDMQDAAVLWLPGGVTAYVDVNKDGILCIGVGWYSDEGINLVMERDYGLDGKLKEVRSKSELKRRWPDSGA